MARPSKYCPELREGAVRMVFDDAGEYPRGGRQSGRRQKESAVQWRCFVSGCGKASANVHHKHVRQVIDETATLPAMFVRIAADGQGR